MLSEQTSKMMFHICRNNPMKCADEMRWCFATALRLPCNSLATASGLVCSCLMTA